MLGLGEAPLDVRVTPYPAGPEGIHESLTKMGDLVRAVLTSRERSAKLIGWAVAALKSRGIDGRNRPSARDQFEAILDSVRGTPSSPGATIWVPDPTMTEKIQAADVTLCLRDDGTCIPGGDCDDLVVLVVTLCLAIGLPAQILQQDYGPGIQPHVLVAVEDENGSWLTGDPSSWDPIGFKPPAVREQWVDPLKAMGPTGQSGAELLTLGCPPGLGATSIANRVARMRERLSDHTGRPMSAPIVPQFCTTWKRFFPSADLEAYAEAELALSDATGAVAEFYWQEDGWGDPPDRSIVRASYVVGPGGTLELLTERCMGAVTLGLGLRPPQVGLAPSEQSAPEAAPTDELQRPMPRAEGPIESHSASATHIARRGMGDVQGLPPGNWVPADPTKLLSGLRYAIVVGVKGGCYGIFGDIWSGGNCIVDHALSSDEARQVFSRDMAVESVVQVAPETTDVTDPFVTTWLVTGVMKHDTDYTPAQTLPMIYVASAWSEASGTVTAPVPPKANAAGAPAPADTGIGVVGVVGITLGGAVLGGVAWGLLRRHKALTKRAA